MPRLTELGMDDSDRVNWTFPRPLKISGYPLISAVDALNRLCG